MRKTWILLALVVLTAYSVSAYTLTYSLYDTPTSDKSLDVSVWNTTMTSMLKFYYNTSSGYSYYKGYLNGGAPVPDYVMKRANKSNVIGVRVNFTFQKFAGTGNSISMICIGNQSNNAAEDCYNGYGLKAGKDGMYIVFNYKGLPAAGKNITNGACNSTFFPKFINSSFNTFEFYQLPNSTIVAHNTNSTLPASYCYALNRTYTPNSSKFEYGFLSHPAGGNGNLLNIRQVYDIRILGSSGGTASFITPTPSNNTYVYKYNKNISVSCDSGNATIWFGTATNPAQKVAFTPSVTTKYTINSSAMPSSGTYYFKGGCSKNGVSGINTSIYRLNYNPLYVPECRNITSTGSYQVTNNITANQSYCIMVSANNVALDCKGMFLKGNLTKYYLVYSNKNHTNIKSCNLKESIAGDSGSSVSAIYYENSWYSNITNITYNATGTDKPYRVIDIDNAKYNYIYKNTFMRVGIPIDGSKLNESYIFNNKITNYATGFASASRPAIIISTHNMVYNNIIQNRNWSSGVAMLGENNSIYNNTIKNISTSKTSATASAISSSITAVAKRIPNKIYANFFNTTHYLYYSGILYNSSWNGSLWGNYYGNWSNPSQGFSALCTDADGNRICDSSYTIYSKNIDYKPLKLWSNNLTFSSNMQFSSVTVNNTKPKKGQSVFFGINIFDNDKLSHYIFSFYNYSNNAWKNLSAVSFGTNVKSKYINVTRTMPKTPYQTRYNYTWYANDSYKQWSHYTSYIIINSTNATNPNNLIKVTNPNNSTFTYDMNCTEYDNDTIRYFDNTTLFNINITTGVWSDKPTISEVGSYSIKLLCGDNLTNITDTFIYNVTNTVPNYSSFAFYPATNDGSKNMRINYTASDAQLNYIYNYSRWYKNKKLNSTWNNLKLIGEKNFTSGDNMTVTVWIGDLNLNSSKKNYTISLNDTTAPVIYNATVSSITATLNDVGYLYATCIDASSSVSSVVFTLLDSDDIVYVLSQPTPSGNIYSRQITLNKVGKWKYKNVTCTDTAGNVRRNSTVAVNITVASSSGGSTPDTGGGGGGSTPQCTSDDNCLTYGLNYYCVNAQCVKVTREDLAYVNLNKLNLPSQVVTSLLAYGNKICDWNGVCQLEEGENINNCGDQFYTVDNKKYEIKGDCTGFNSLPQPVIVAGVVVIIVIFGVLGSTKGGRFR